MSLRQLAQVDPTVAARTDPAMLAFWFHLSGVPRLRKTRAFATW
jgi:hypothetical protein